jgi:hypothetical protein
MLCPPSSTTDNSEFPPQRYTLTEQKK